MARVRCGGSLLAHQASGAEGPGSNPASHNDHDALQIHCVYCTLENLRVKRETYTAEAKTNNQPNSDNSRNKYNSFYLNTKLVNNKKKKL